MKLHSTALLVSDMNKSAHFYGELLGLENYMEHDVHIAYTSGLNIWQKEAAQELLQMEIRTDRDAHSMELCFVSEDIESDCKKLKSAGVQFMSEIQAQPWQQIVFRVFDPDGNIVEIGEDISDTFRRLLEDGNSLSEVSRMTFTAEEDIKKMLGL